MYKYLAVPVGIGLWGVYMFAGVHAHAALTAQVKQLIGNGDFKKQTRNLSSFDHIEIGDAFEVKVREAAKSELVIETDGNILNLVKSNIESGKLSVSLKTDQYDSRRPIKLYITSPTVKRVTLSGASSAAFENCGAHPFNLRGSGASSFSLKGKTTELDLNLAGASSFNSGKLNLKSAMINIQGASKATIPGTLNQAQIVISGASSLQGRPRVLAGKVRANGASSVSAILSAAVRKEVTGASSISD